eukprot:721825-Rhodomonas_salina.1
MLLCKSTTNCSHSSFCAHCNVATDNLLCPVSGDTRVAFACDVPTFDPSLAREIGVTKAEARAVVSETKTPDVDAAHIARSTACCAILVPEMPAMTATEKGGGRDCEYKTLRPK